MSGLNQLASAIVLPYFTNAIQPTTLVDCEIKLYAPTIYNIEHGAAIFFKSRYSKNILSVIFSYQISHETIFSFSNCSISAKRIILAGFFCTNWVLDSLYDSWGEISTMRNILSLFEFFLLALLFCY